MKELTFPKLRSLILEEDFEIMEQALTLLRNLAHSAADGPHVDDVEELVSGFGKEGLIELLLRELYISQILLHSDF